MAEANLPEQPVNGELSKETKEKAMEMLWVKYGQMVDAILMKDGGTRKSRGRRRGPAEGPADAKGAAGKGEQAAKPPPVSDRLAPPPPAPPPPRCPGPPRGGRGGRRGRGGRKRK